MNYIYTKIYILDYRQREALLAELQNPMPIYSTYNSFYCCMHRSTKSSHFE